MDGLLSYKFCNSEIIICHYIQDIMVSVWYDFFYIYTALQITQPLTE